MKLYDTFGWDYPNKDDLISWNVGSYLRMVKTTIVYKIEIKIKEV